MEYQNLYQDGTPPPAPAPREHTRTGRTRRVVASAAAATVLLGGGAAIGIAMTGGASAAPGGSAANSQVAAVHCHRGVRRLLVGRHPRAARRVAASRGASGSSRLLAPCASPLRRLIAAGAIHGEVTFRRKEGIKTLAFERGTVQAASASAVTVRAPDGTSWTWDIVTRTVLRERGHQPPSLAPGEQVLVAGQVVSGVRDARVIWIRQPG
jgi:hypothetical protein